MLSFFGIHTPKEYKKCTRIYFFLKNQEKVSFRAKNFKNIVSLYIHKNMETYDIIGREKEMSELPST
jgi:hypothetical protein